MSNKGPDLHVIKLDIQFCDAVYLGTKTFEVRKKERDYKLNDIVAFIPVKNGEQTDHPILYDIFKITYILEGWGIQDGYCAFAIQKVEEKK